MGKTNNVLSPHGPQGYVSLADTPSINTYGNVAASSLGGVQSYKGLNQEDYLKFTPLLHNRNFEIDRALGQSNWNQFKRMMTRGGAKALLTVPEFFGYIGDLPTVFGIVDDYDNTLSAWVRELKGEVDEKFADYSGALHADTTKFDPGSFDWWMRNGDTVIESLGYFVGGGVAGLAGKAAMRGLASSTKLFGLLNNAQKAEKFGAVFSGAIANNYVEAMQNAGETYRDLLSKGYSKEVASKQASKIVWQGKLLLALEIPQYASLFRGMGHSRSMKDLGKGFFGKEYIKQFANESGEEIYQGFLQNEAQYNVGAIEGKGTKLERLFDYTFSDEGLTAGFLGGFGGVAFQGATDGLYAAREVFSKTPSAKSMALSRIDANKQDIVDILKGNLEFKDDAEKAAIEGDESKFKKAQKKMFLGLALANAQSGTYEQFLERIEDFGRMTPEEAESLGIDLKTAKGLVQEYKKEAHTVEKLFNEVDREFSDKDSDFKRAVLTNKYEHILARQGFAESTQKLDNLFNTAISDGIIDATQSESMKHSTELEAVQLDLKKTREANDKKPSPLYEGYIKFLEKQEKALTSAVKTATSRLQPVIGASKQLDPIEKQRAITTAAEKRRHEYLMEYHADKFEEFKNGKFEEKRQAEIETIEEKAKESIKKAAVSKVNKRINDFKDAAVGNKAAVTEKTIEELDAAYKEVLESPEYQVLSEEEKAETKANYNAAKKQIKKIIKAKAGSTKKAGTKGQEAESRLSEETSPAFMEELGLDPIETEIIGQGHIDEDAVTDIAKRTKYSLNRSDNRTGPKKGNIILKKDAGNSFAYKDVNYNVTEDGEIVDAEGEDILNILNDGRLHDYNYFKPGDAIEFVIDFEYAQKEGIPITPENWWRIPIGIRLPNGQITAGVHVFKNAPKDGELDSNLAGYFLRFDKDGNELIEDALEIQQSIIDIRKSLILELLNNKKEKVVGKIHKKSTGILKFDEWIDTLDALGDGNKLADDVFFGVVDEFGQIKHAGGKIDNYVIEDFKSKGAKKRAVEGAGLPVALIPTNAKSGGKTVLTPVFLTLQKLTEEDLDLAVDIMLMTKEEIAKIKNWPKDKLPNSRNLLNTLIFNGAKGGAFVITELTKGDTTVKHMINTWSYSDNKIKNIDKNTTIEIVEENREIIKEKLRQFNYTVKINQTKALVPVKNADGTIGLKSVDNTKLIAQRTKSNISSIALPGTNRRKFARQPVITFDIPNISSDEADTQKTRETEESDENLGIPDEMRPKQTPSVKKTPTAKSKVGTKAAAKKTRARKVTKKKTDAEAGVKPKKKVEKTPTSAKKDAELKAHYDALTGDELAYVNALAALDSFTSKGITTLLVFGQQRIDTKLASKHLEEILLTLYETKSLEALQAIVGDTLVENLQDSLNISNSHALGKLKTVEDKVGFMVDSVQDSLDPNLSRLGRILAGFLDLGKVSISFENRGLNSPIMRAVTKDGKQSIIINADAFVYSSRQAPAAFAHELLHLATSQALQYPKTAAEKQFAKDIQNLYTTAKALAKNPNQLGYKNIREFVAEAFTNKSFREELAGMSVNKKNLWTKFIEFLGKLVGMDTNILEEVERLTYEFLQEPSNAQLSKESVEDTLLDIFTENGFLLQDVFDLSASINYLVLYELKKNPKQTYSRTYSRVNKRLANQVDYLKNAGQTKYAGLLEKVIANGGDNPLYKAFVQRSKTYIKNNIQILRDFTTDIELDYEESDESVGEGIENYGKEAWELNPKDSATKRLKNRLSFIIKQTKINGIVAPETNNFMLYSYIPFDILYNTISEALTDLPAEEFMPKLEILSQYNPTLKQFVDELQRSENSESQNDRAFFKEFHSHFQKQRAKLVTPLFSEREISTLEGDSSLVSYNHAVIYANIANSDEFVIRNWFDRFKYGNNVSNNDGEFVINRDKMLALKEKLEEARVKYSNLEYYEYLITDILPELGINLPIEVANLVYHNTKLVGRSFQRQDFAKIVSRLVDTASKELAKTADDEVTYDFKNTNFFIEEAKNVRVLASLSLLVEGTVFSTLYRNDEGKNIYTIFQNHHLSKTFEGLKFGSLAESMLDDPFRSRSSILQKINDGDPSFVYDLHYISTLSEQGGGLTGTTYKNLSPQDRQFARFVLFANGSKHTGFFIPPTISDKPTIPVIRTNKMFNTYKNGKLSEEASKEIMNLVAAEYQRIVAVYEEQLAAKELAEAGDNSLMHELIENYHYTGKKDEAGFLNAQGLKFHFFPLLNGVKTLDELVEAESFDSLKEELLQVINNNIFEIIEQVKDQFVEYGFFNRETNTFTGRVASPILASEYELTPDEESMFTSDITVPGKTQMSESNTNLDLMNDYVVNYMIQNGNFYQIFANDIAFTKGYTDMAKRLAMVLAPGQEFFLEGNMKTVLFDDVEFPSDQLFSLYKAVKDVYVKAGKTLMEAEDEAKKLLKSYESTNNTDAQGYVTLDEYAKLLDGLGRLDADMQTAIDAARNGTLHTLEDGVQKILQPLKPVYVGDVIDESLGDGRTVRKYIKLSVIPLYKELTQSFPELDAVRKDMEEKNVGMAAYVSAGKTGNKLVQKFGEPIAPGAIQELPYSGLKLQQEIPYDENKKQIKTVTQARKMVMQDLKDPLFNTEKFVTEDGSEFTAEELYREHENLYIENFNDEWQIFKKEFGVDQDAEGNLFITDVVKVNKLLRKEAVARGFDENSIEALQLSDDGKSFKIPLWFTPQSESFESLLLSTISTRLAKRKQKGKSFVQASNQGFGDTRLKTSLTQAEIDAVTWIDEATKNTFIDKMQNPALKGIEYDADSYSLSPEQILLPNIYKRQFKKGEKIDLATLKAKGLLRAFAMRIPNQGHNSMVMVEIAGFLPPSSGDMVVVHQDMLKRMGSDFDVDKLYLYLYEVEKEGDSISKVEYSISETEADLKRLYEAKVQEAIRYYKDSFPEYIEALEDQNEEISKLKAEQYQAKTVREKKEYQELIDEAFAKIFVHSRVLRDMMIKEGIVPSYEQFIELSPMQRNTTAARHNRVLDLYQSIFSRPEILTKLLMPNSVEDLRSANEAFDEFDPAPDEISPLSIITQDNLFDDNASGKTGIGIASLWNTFHSTIQYHDIILSKIGFSKESHMHYIKAMGPKFIIEKDGREVETQEEKTQDEHKLELIAWQHIEEQFFARTGKKIPAKYKTSTGLHKLGKVRGENGNFISYIIQVVQSAAVDNAKEQELNRANLNLETFNTALYLAAMGIDDFNMIVGFMRQPILKEWVKQVNFKKTKSSTQTNYGSMDVLAAAELVEKYKNLLQELKADVHDAVYEDDLIQAFSIKNLQALMKVSKSLKEDVEVPRETLIKYYTGQLEVLKAFMMYKKEGDILAQMMNAYNTDTQSIGKNWFTVKKKNEAGISSGILPSEQMTAAKKLFVGQDSLLSTLNGRILEDAIGLGMTVFNQDDLFPYSKPFFKEAFKIEDHLNRKVNDQLFRDIKRSILLFLMSNTDLNIYKNKDLTAKKLRSKYVRSKNNIAKQLAELKNRDEFALNVFLQRLNTSDNRTLKKAKISKVDFMHLNMEPNEVIYVVSAFLELLNSQDEQAKTFAEGLIEYSYLVEGLVSSSSSVASYIPIQVILDAAVAQQVSQISNLLSPEVIERFHDQFVRHNKDKLPRIKFTGNAATDGPYTQVVLSELGVPKYGLIRRGGKDRIHKFFKSETVDGVTSHIYKYMPELGHEKLPEYDFKLDEPLSELKRNKVPNKLKHSAYKGKIEIRSTKQSVTNNKKAAEAVNDEATTLETSDNAAPMLAFDESMENLFFSKEDARDTGETTQKAENKQGDLFAGVEVSFEEIKSNALDTLKSRTDKLSDRQITIWTNKINKAKTDEELGNLIKKICKL